MSANNPRRGRRWVWGCLGGCFGFILIVGILIGVGIWLLVRAVPVVPPETFVNAETTAFLIVRMEPDDAVMSEVLLRVAGDPGVQGVMPRQQVGGPPDQLAETGESVRSLAPLQAVAVLEPDGDERPFRAGVAVSVHRLSRMFRMVFRLGAIGSGAEYKGVTIGGSQRGTLMAARNNNFMLASRQETITSWIDRLEEQRAREKTAPRGQAPVPELGADEPLRVAYGRLDRQRPVRFASLNAHGELEWIVAIAAGEQWRQSLVAAGLTAPGVLSLSGQVALLNSREGQLTMWVECADGPSAETIERNMREVAQATGEEFPLKELDFRREGENVVRMEGRVEDLPGRIADLVTRMAEATPALP